MRTRLSTNDLGELIDEISQIAAILARTVKTMNDAKLEETLIHASSAMKHWVPNLRSWAEETELATAKQIRELRAGRVTSAEKRQAEHARDVEKQRSSKPATSSSRKK